MNVQDFVNAPASAATAADSAGTPRSGAFITPQSLVSFPLASGLVAGLWQAAGRLHPELGKSPWTALGLALFIGLLIYAISINDSKLRMSRRDKAIALAIAIINSLYLFLAALGIAPTTAAPAGLP